MAIMAKMPDRTKISIERCAVILELLFFEWKNYQKELNIKIDVEDIEQHLSLNNLGINEKREVLKIANNYRTDIVRTVEQLDRMLKKQLQMFDKLPESRMGELEEISNEIFKNLNNKLTEKVVQTIED